MRYLYTLFLLFVSMASKADTLFQKDVNCLTDAIYFESKGGSEQDMKDVGHVVLNRTDSPKFPKRICDVVYQRYKSICQFSWACSRRSVKEPKEYEKSKEYAKQLLTEEYSGSRQDTTNDALFFHTLRLSPRWKEVKKCHINKQHIFYRSSIK